MKPLAHVAAGFGWRCWWPHPARPPGWRLSTRLVASVALPLGAMALLAAGLVRRMWVWARTPVPYRIPTTAGQQRSLPWLKPGRLESPSTPAGVVGRMALEGLLFRPLLPQHAGRGPARLPPRPPREQVSLAGRARLPRLARRRPAPAPALRVRAGALARLAGRRHRRLLPARHAGGSRERRGAGRRAVGPHRPAPTVPRVRYVSLASDFFPLGLLAGIAATGLLMRHLWGGCRGGQGLRDERRRAGPPGAGADRHAARRARRHGVGARRLWCRTESSRTWSACG